jgi:hypothetical protein
MPITAPPDPPSIDDPENFAVKAQAFTEWMVTFRDELDVIIGQTIPAGSAAAGTLTGTEMASNVVTSSLTSLALATLTAICQGRLTLTAGTPVTIGNVSAATTIYFTPFKGGAIALYDGISKWTVRTFVETSIAVPATTSQMYDLFGYDNSGTLAIEATAWTNDTTRATALTTQNGVLVKTGDTTRRYLGSFRTTGVSGQTEDSLTKRFVWNYYNRVSRPMKATDATNSWSYTTAAYRQANASTANQLDFIQGVSEEPVTARVVGFVQSNQAGQIVATAGIGLDSTTVNSADIISGNTIVQNQHNPTEGIYRGHPGVGRHYLAWLEYSTAVGVTTWFGDNNQPSLQQAGIVGEVVG